MRAPHWTSLNINKRSLPVCSLVGSSSLYVSWLLANQPDAYCHIQDWTVYIHEHVRAQKAVTDVKADQRETGVAVHGTKQSCLMWKSSCDDLCLEFALIMIHSIYLWSQKSELGMTSTFQLEAGKASWSICTGRQTQLIRARYVIVCAWSHKNIICTGMSYVSVAF